MLEFLVMDFVACANSKNRALITAVAEDNLVESIEDITNNAAANISNAFAIP